MQVYINLPNDDGFKICTEIRSFSKVPIIFITSRNTNIDELMAITLGGDDFITKPYIIYKNIINNYIGNEVFILTIILGVILMIGIYLCYFVGTYYSFKRNINN